MRPVHQIYRRCENFHHVLYKHTIWWGVDPSRSALASCIPGAAGCVEKYWLFLRLFSLLLPLCNRHGMSQAGLKLQKARHMRFYRSRVRGLKTTSSPLLHCTLPVVYVRSGPQTQQPFLPAHVPRGPSDADTLVQEDKPFIHRASWGT